MIASILFYSFAVPDIMFNIVGLPQRGVFARYSEAIQCVRDSNNKPGLLYASRSQRQKARFA